MALQSSGAISLQDIANEFGGSTPHSLSEYYGAASGIPSSGTIDFADFYGKSAAIDIGWMLVAGAGGGNSGGGGAGGMKEGTASGLTSGQTISITIGGGGTGGRSGVVTNGSGSSMSGQVSASCTGGGGGGTQSAWAISGNANAQPRNGGSVEVVVVTTTQEVLVFLAKVVMVDMVHKMVTSVLEVAVERTLLAVTAHQVTLETEVLLSRTS